jgi:hypothetical protein
MRRVLPEGHIASRIRCTSNESKKESQMRIITFTAISTSEITQIIQHEVLSGQIKFPKRSPKLQFYNRVNKTTAPAN